MCEEVYPTEVKPGTEGSRDRCSNLLSYGHINRKNFNNCY